MSELNKNYAAAFKLKLEIQRQLTEAFGVEKGLRQCDALTATLFHIVLEKVIRDKETNPNGKKITERDIVWHMQMMCL